ncbi:hypothetical protein CHUAL_007686 [Chamberlinius hualienensis]
MMNFFAVFILASVFCFSEGFLSQQTDLFGKLTDSKCDSDPANNCKDFNQAFLCNSLERCIDKWSGLLIPSDDMSEKCSQCKSMVIESRTELLLSSEENWTTAISDTLSDVCLYNVDMEYFDCLTLMDNLANNLKILLKSQLDSDSICLLLMHCTSNSDITKLQLDASKILGEDNDSAEENSSEESIVNSIADKDMRLEKLKDSSEELDVKFDDKEATVNEPSSTVIEPCGEEDNSVLCPLCEFAMSELETALADKQTEKEIDELIKNICSRLPATVTQECDEFIDQYADQILIIIAEEMNATNVCSLLNICPKIVGLGGEDVCVGCNYAMRLLHQVLNFEDTKDQIEMELEGVCDLMPTVWYSTCMEFVESYSRDLLNKLTAMDLSVVCDSVDICSVQPMLLETSLDIETRALDLAARNKCLACITTLETIKKYSIIMSKSLDVVCYFIPPEFSVPCKFLVEQLGPLLVKLLNNEIHPEQLCQRIHLCQKFESDPLAESELDFFGDFYDF